MLSISETVSVSCTDTVDAWFIQATKLIWHCAHETTAMPRYLLITDTWSLA